MTDTTDADLLLKLVRDTVGTGGSEYVTLRRVLDRLAELERECEMWAERDLDRGQLLKDAEAANVQWQNRCVTIASDRDAAEARANANGLLRQGAIWRERCEAAEARANGYLKELGVPAAERWHEREQLQAQLAQAQEALRDYGQHLTWCNSRNLEGPTFPECDCGYRQARAVLAKGETP